MNPQEKNSRRDEFENAIFNAATVFNGPTILNGAVYKSKKSHDTSTAKKPYKKPPTKVYYHYDSDDDRDEEDRVLLPINTQDDEYYFRTNQKFKKYLEERREVAVKKRSKPVQKTTETYESEFHLFSFSLTEAEIEEDLKIIKDALSN